VKTKKDHCILHTSDILWQHKTLFTVLFFYFFWRFSILYFLMAFSSIIIYKNSPHVFKGISYITQAEVDTIKKKKKKKKNWKLNIRI